MRADGSTAVFPHFVMDRGKPGTVCVNQSGRRFVNESTSYHRFVRAMYEQTVGLVLPRRANEQAAATQTIDRQDLQPGDLVFFNTMKRAFSHVGIYVGNGKFIHSPKPGAEVRVEDMGVSYWARRFDGARRVATGPADAPSPQR